MSVRFRRRAARLANLFRQVAQVVESLAEDAQLVLDVSASSRLMEFVDEPEKKAAETATGAPAKPASTALLGVPELAAFLDVEASTVRRWRRAGKLPASVEIGGVTRWRPEVIDEWLREREAAR